MARPTMTLHTIPSNSPAAGHSGQNSTTRRSEIKLSKIARYSASLLDFVIFVFPDLVKGYQGNYVKYLQMEDTFVLKKGR